MIRQELTVALRVTAVTLVLTGLLYPLLTTGVANVLFPARAQGSFVADERGTVVGSELIGQGFAGEAYLQPRPSAAGEKGWDAAGSSSATTVAARNRSRRSSSPHRRAGSIPICRRRARSGRCRASRKLAGSRRIGCGRSSRAVSKAATCSCSASLAWTCFSSTWRWTGHSDVRRASPGSSLCFLHGAFAGMMPT